ncbi:MAG: alpha-2-macroglobulin family protein [Acidobacteriota bacterium]
MKTAAPLATLLILGTLIVFGAPQSAAPYPEVKAQAERLYAEGSYQRAHELYRQARDLDLPASEARWINFRLADTQWRAEASTQTYDTTQLEEARRQLEALITAEQKPDGISAEVRQSLGDFWWVRRNSKNWGSAWTHYQTALQWWASSRDVETARRRYLEIVWTISDPGWDDSYYYYGSYGNYLPLEILENALKIARTAQDRAHARYLVAMTLQNQGDYRQRQRVGREFEAALEGDSSNPWYDDALFQYAQWLANSGKVSLNENGQWIQQPDYVRALELFRRLIEEFSKGETRYFDQAVQQIESITSPSLGLSVSNVFLPDSEIQFYANWRNVRNISFALHRVNLTRDIHLDRDHSDWLAALAPSRGAPYRTWSKDTGDRGEHKPGSESLKVEGRLPLGAYLLEASGNGRTARELILVTDTSLVLKTQGTEALVYYCSALDGSPIPGSRVSLWQYTNQSDPWRKLEMTTDSEGIAVFDVGVMASGWQTFAFAALDERQAFGVGNTSYYATSDQWKIYAFTDRPAYRPGQQVSWKIVARMEKDFRLTTPSQQTVEFDITDPRGTTIHQSKAALNAFGSAWGSLEVTEEMPLGEYSVQFWDEGRVNSIGSATLFRLEEYKLPEFKVTVETPEEDGRRKVFRLGDTVEVRLQVDYYFGAPVADAEMDILVYQRPFYHSWNPPRRYPWFYPQSSGYQNYYGGGRGQVIRQEKIKTDINGRALFSFDSPSNLNQDQEYEIEARVRDSSRREVIGRDTLRVTRQPYFVYLHPDHNLYRPKDRVGIKIKSLDANDQPSQVQGTIKVQRSRWVEIWIDRDGREIEGERRPGSSVEGWSLKHRGYQHQEVLSQTITTDEQGEAELRFSADQEGYYQVGWSSHDETAGPIVGSTAVWVGDNNTTELGYRHGGVEIVLDKDTVQVGQRTPVMLTTQTSNRYVLFSLEAETLHDYQLVHVTGNAKLIEVLIEDHYVPNLFLSAVMVSDRQIFMDTKEVVVPPVDHFLQVEVHTDRAQYEPRQTGRITVKTTDRHGNPVSAEVSIGMVDESIYAIQSDYASDPRQFFYGKKHPRWVQTSSSFQQKSYIRLVAGPDDQLMDERVRDNLGDKTDGAGGVVGQLQRGFANAARKMAMSQDAAAPYGMVAEESAFREGEALAPTSSMAAPGQAGDEPAVQVRSDFRATAFWRSHVVTDPNGQAVLDMKFPDSLTSWRTTVRAVGHDSDFGWVKSEVRTNQPLIVRLQAPRFFVVGDRVTLSAVINNNTDQTLDAHAQLQAEGLDILGLIENGRIVKDETGSIEVEAGAQKRLNWIASVPGAGPVKLSVVARADLYADAMENTYRAYEHGIEKFLSQAGKMRSSDLTVHLDLPSQRKPESTAVTIQLTPSLAVTMLDALPYLIDYPYGCTEQTMSRFLPAAITARTLEGLGLTRDAIRGKTFGGIVPDHLAQTHPEGTRDLRELDDMIQQGLERLYDFQHSDGGWGWWKEGESDHFMTSYVTWGLTLAQEADIQVNSEVLRRAVNFLDQEIVEAENTHDLQAWMLHALSSYHQSTNTPTVGRLQSKAFDNLWSHRDRLNAYTRSLLALSAHAYGFTERARTLVRNLENGVKIDRDPGNSMLNSRQNPDREETLGTAHWGEDGVFWRWSDGGVEATAFALKALLTIDPGNSLIEPVTNWLIKNRRGSQWSNTRDTAIVVLAMNDYLRESGELQSQVEYAVRVNGQLVAERIVTPEEILEAPSQFIIDPELLRNGTNEIQVVKASDQSPLYFSVQAQFFSLEEPLTASGNEIFVRRQYYKLVPQPTLLNGYINQKQPLGDGESTVSGERIEVVLTIEAKNNYEYLLFEDLKPAGLEAVELKSGGPLYVRELRSGAVPSSLDAGEIKADAYTGRSRWVYRELRDRKVAFFIDKLPEGVWEIRYQLRAEVPGHFHALPVLGHAMYVPEIRTSGEEIRLEVKDES